MNEEQTIDIGITLQDALTHARFHARLLERVIESTGDSELMEMAYAVDGYSEELVQYHLDELDGALGDLCYAQTEDDDESGQDEDPDPSDVAEVLDEIDPDLS